MSDQIDADVAALYALLDDVAAHAHRARPSTAEGLSEPEELVLLLFVSTYEVYLGIRALLRERLAEEGRMLSRTLLDDTARLIWLATGRTEREARALQFTYSTIEHERGVYRAAKENGYEWAAPGLADLDDQLKVVNERAASLGITLEPLPNPRTMLRSLGQGTLYYWHVRASQAVHSTRFAMSVRFLPHRNDENHFRIELKSPIDEVAQVAVMAMQTFSMAMIAAADVLGWESRQGLVEYRARIVRMSGDLFERIKARVAERGDQTLPESDVGG